MKILIGVTGFGNGHTARQADVLKTLVEREHQVAIFGYLNSERYFRQYYPNTPVFRIRVPIIHISPQTGIDFAKTAQEPFNHFTDGHQLNFDAMQRAYDYFGGRPDLVISDYEMIAAQFAYALDVPLVTLDQQSKFAGFQFPDLHGHSRREESARLKMFFPCAEARFACSFFQIPYPPDPSFEVEIIPPILREEITRLAVSDQLSDSQEIVVYISPHLSTRQSLAEISDILAGFPEKRFLIFQPRQEQDDHHNLSFRPYDVNDFAHALERAAAVITTAGHNLLSELMYLRKPVFTIPMETFDQHCCAEVIQKNQLGVKADAITAAELAAFFAQLTEYKENLNAKRGLVKAFNGIAVLMEKLHVRFGI